MFKNSINFIWIKFYQISVKILFCNNYIHSNFIELVESKNFNENPINSLVFYLLLREEWVNAIFSVDWPQKWTIWVLWQAWTEKMGDGSPMNDYPNFFAYFTYFFILFWLPIYATGKPQKSFSLWSEFSRALLIFKGSIHLHW